MAKLVWFIEPHTNKGKGKRVLVNVENITCIVPSDDSNDKTVIFFNGDEQNLINVRGTIEEVYKTIELA